MAFTKNATWTNQKDDDDPDWKQSKLDYLMFDCASLYMQMILFTFDTYVLVFLVYVIYRFSHEDAVEMVDDLILGKKVNLVVAIKNQKLL